MNLSIALTIFSGMAMATCLFMVTYFLLKKEQKLANTFLGLLFLAIGLRITKSLFYYILSGLSDLGTAFGFLGFASIGPLLLYYLKVSEDEKYVFSIKDSWHFIFSGIGFTAIILKLYIPYYWYALALVQLGIYLVFSGYHFIFKSKSRTIVSWHKKLFYAIVTLFGILTYQLLTETMFGYVIGTALASLVIYAIFFMALQSPKLLRSASKEKHVSDDLVRRIVNVIENERIYLQPAITLAQFSEAINTPAYLVSKAIKVTYNKSFPEIINSFRIKEIIKKLSEPNHANDKIENLAYDAGFNTSSAFYNAFKKETSMSPRAYQKMVQNNIVQS